MLRFGCDVKHPEAQRSGTMTADIDRRKRVADVIAIIGRDKAREDEVEKAIQQLESEPAHPVLGPRGGWYRPLNTLDKKVAKSLGMAIGRLERKLGRANVAGVLYRATVNQHDEFFEWKEQLAHWRKRFEAFAGVAKAEAGGLFDDTNSRPLGHWARARRFARKNIAAAQAANLLDVHGLSLTATQRTATQKPSVFCRVAAVLFGDKSENFYHQCRNIIKARNRGCK
jgi:hypothetical protein